MVYTTHYQSPLGALLLAARGDALAGLWLEGQKYFLGSLKEPAEPWRATPCCSRPGIGCPATLRGSGRIPVS